MNNKGTKLEGKSPGECDSKAMYEEELEEEHFRERDQQEPRAWRDKVPGEF